MVCPQLGIAGILAFLWVAGIFFELFFFLWGKYVSVTSSVRDNEIFNAVISNWLYVSLAFGLYLFVRIKLPTKENL